MIRAPRLLVVGSILLATAASPVTAQRAADPLRGLDAYIEKARQDWGVAGLGVAIVKSVIDQILTHPRTRASTAASGAARSPPSTRSPSGPGAPRRATAAHPTP